MLCVGEKAPKAYITVSTASNYQCSGYETLSDGQNSISNCKTLLLAKRTLSHVKNTVNRVKH